MPREGEKHSSADQAEMVARALEEDIVLGRLSPRERLIEEDLVQRFNVGRHVVRQALSELEGMGIVMRPRNRSASVRDLQPDDVKQIYALRELLEGKAAELLELPADPELVSTLQQIHARHERAVKAGDLAEVYRQNMLFHRTFFFGCGNPYLAEAIQQAALKAHIVRSSTVGDPALLMRSVAEHVAIIDAMERGDRARLIELVKAHIQPSMTAYIHSYEKRFGTFEPRPMANATA